MVCQCFMRNRCKFVTSICHPPSSLDSKKQHQFQITIILQMIGVIQFTAVSQTIILKISIWISFEVKTDTVVFQVAQKLTVIQILDAFLLNGIVYQTSFRKKVEVWKQYCAHSLLKKINNSNINDNNNNGDEMFSEHI